MTLARNGALADAVLVSGDEDLAQIVADAQDLGVRVTVVHVAVDGNWTISRVLRQECDDLIEIGAGHLRPYVNLLAGVDVEAIRARGFRLVVDYGFSAASFVLPLVLGPLGVEAVSAHGFTTDRTDSSSALLRETVGQVKQLVPAAVLVHDEGSDHSVQIQVVLTP